MKLGSNRKSIGMGAGYREFSYDNKRVREVFKIMIKIYSPWERFRQQQQFSNCTVHNFAIALLKL